METSRPRMFDSLPEFARPMVPACHTSLFCSSDWLPVCAADMPSWHQICRLEMAWEWIAIELNEASLPV
jgi:hypothetical protein